MQVRLRTKVRVTAVTSAASLDKISLHNVAAAQLIARVGAPRAALPPGRADFVDRAHAHIRCTCDGTNGRPVRETWPRPWRRSQMACNVFPARRSSLASQRDEITKAVSGDAKEVLR
jgi:hypothetical protein